MARWKLAQIAERLAAAHGEPQPPPARDPWRLVLWENVAYLADDLRRRAAFELLESSVGLAPSAILAASDAKLRKVASHGILAETFAEKLRTCAKLALELAPESDGDLGLLTQQPLAKAKKALKRFPGIGDPGAEKILLFAGAHATLALESNGLRVLTRLGFAPEGEPYAATYRRVREAVAPELSDDCVELARMHELLRRHGKTICKSSKPNCEQCALVSRCAFRQS